MCNRNHMGYIMIILRQCTFEEDDHNWVNGDIVGIGLPVLGLFMYIVEMHS